MTNFAITGKTYPVKDQLKALGCRWDSFAKTWVAPNATIYAQAIALVPAPAPARETPAPVAIDGIEPVVALLKNAAPKRPKLLVRAGDESLRLSIAGSMARYPGTINITSTSVDGEGEREWYGRIHLDGRFEASRRIESATADAVLVALREVATDPAKAAARYGHLTGFCCFCGRKLDDERSTLVGYGPVCADSYNLPWGERPAKSERPAEGRAKRAKIADLSLEDILDEVERDANAA